MDVPDWISDYFERGYAQRWSLGAPTRQVQADAKGLCALLHLTAGSHVVDIGCGHGRYALAFASHGAEVTAIDFADALLTRAKDLAAASGAHVHWVRGDMRQLPFRSGFASAGVLLDALGFFDTEEENTSVLCEAARVLKPGGRLALKVVNGGPVLDAFQETGREEHDGVVVTISRTLGFGPPRMTERIRISGGRGEYVRRQRLYRSEELRDTLDGLGFHVEGPFADPQRTPFQQASAAIWIVAQR